MAKTIPSFCSKNEALGFAIVFDFLKVLYEPNLVVLIAE